MWLRTLSKHILYLRYLPRHGMRSGNGVFQPSHQIALAPWADHGSWEAGPEWFPPLVWTCGSDLELQRGDTTWYLRFRTKTTTLKCSDIKIIFQQELSFFLNSVRLSTPNKYSNTQMSESENKKVKDLTNIHFHGYLRVGNHLKDLHFKKYPLCGGASDNCNNFIYKAEASRL